jgi:hypothetical protein
VTGQRKHSRGRDTEYEVSDDDRADAAEHDADCSTSRGAGLRRG